MKKIPSFTIDHTRLQPGVYVSRRDYTPAGDCVTTFDIRLTAPNHEPALSPEALHAMEHLAATWMRNDPEWAARTVYWGPMGCCTGCYLLVQGELEPADVVPMLRRLFDFMAAYVDEIPGASPRDCGNYSFMDPAAARAAAARFAALLASDSLSTSYPE